MKNILITLFYISLFLFNVTPVFAQEGKTCNDTSDCQDPLPAYCQSGQVWQATGASCNPDKHICQYNHGPAAAGVGQGLSCYGNRPTNGFENVFGTITAPAPLKNIVAKGKDESGGALGAFLNNLLAILFSLVGFIFLFMIVFGAFQWITAGADKEAVAKSRARITNAVIGIVILSLAFFLTRFVGELLGFHWF